ncbi:MAG: epoxyqueuosine reductase QueH [Clostridia bacterium]
MALLLHICCAPCSIMCVETLRAEGLEPTGFWENPNIHPYTEYRARKNALVDYAKQIRLPLVVHGEYGLRPFVGEVAADIDGRCAKCYALRMRACAAYAAQNGFAQFTSTLFVSPYQNHELLKGTAESAAREFGVEFLYRDFRPYFREGQERARALELYMQKYCGCIFSEEERYRKRPKPAAPQKEEK